MSRSVLDPDTAANAAGRRTREPCATPGEDTSTGTALYSDRRVLDGKSERTFVCALCVRRLNAARHGPQLTDEELKQAINTAGIAGQAFAASAN